MCRAMFFATSAAPIFFASKGEICLYSVPTWARSASSRTGQFTAAGTWSSANSEGERTSITSSKASSCATVTASRRFSSIPNFIHERTRRSHPSDAVLPRGRLRLQDRAGGPFRDTRQDPDPRAAEGPARGDRIERRRDRKSTRLNSSHLGISYAVFCLKKKKKTDAYKHEE